MMDLSSTTRSESVVSSGATSNDLLAIGYLLTWPGTLPLLVPLIVRVQVFAGAGAGGGGRGGGAGGGRVMTPLVIVAWACLGGGTPLLKQHRGTG
jgi:hypothetical protein